MSFCTTPRTATRRLALLLLVALLGLPSLAHAGQRRHLPPGVDLDPDRQMPFDRLPKSAFDHRELDATKKSLTLRTMDPDIDPYSTLVKPSKYQPYNGQIRGSMTDALRDMRHDEDVARKFSGGAKATVQSPFAPKPPPNLLAGMPHPNRILRSPVVDPMVTLRKQQQNDQKDDSDDD